MEIQTRKEQQALVVQVKGRLEAVTSPEFDQAFAGWLAGGERRFVLSLEGLDYVSSAGLRSLLVAAKQLKAVQGRLVLCGLTKSVAEVFKISGFDTLLTVRPSEAAALEALD
jgi:anti-anti-sigma factor